MPTIDQIYRDNLRLLVKESRGVGALAERVGKSAAQVSQWLNGSKDSKTGKPRSLARATAREIERRAGKPEGWMDQPHRPEQLIEAADAGPTGAIFETLTSDEQRLLDNFRAMLDDDQKQFAEEIAGRAAKMRAYTAKVLEKVGATAKPARTEADAKKTVVARAALDVTEALRQKSLFTDDKSGGKQ